MGIESIIGGALSLAGNLFAGDQAASAQGDASQAAANAQLEALQAARQQLRPYSRAGRASTNQLLTLLGLPGGNQQSRMFGDERAPFRMSDFRADPGYAFRLNEGMDALEAGAAARGGLLSGNTLRATQDYAQGLASNEFGNAFNRFYAMREARLNPLFRLAGLGQSSGTALAGAAQNYGNAMAQNAYNMGNVQAGQYGQMAGAFSNVGNMISQIPQYEQQSRLNEALIRYYGG